MQRRWNGNALKIQCKRWFSLLVKTIEIKRGAESILRILRSLLRSGRDDTITKNKEFRLHIETEVIIITNLKFCFSNESHYRKIGMLSTGAYFRN